MRGAELRCSVNYSPNKIRESRI